VTSAAIGWSLAAISVAWGLGTFWVFRRFSDRAALRIVGKRIYAHLLAIRLFSEEPALVWRAQKALIADNLRFLKLMAVPVLILGIPFALCYEPFDTIYGVRPLQPGQGAIVILHNTDAPATLKVSHEIAIETPPIRNLEARQVSWRIRPLAPVRGNLRVELPGTIVTRSIAAGDPNLSPTYRRESPGSGPWLEVDYPRASVLFFGLSLPWLAWFLLISSASAIILTLWPRPHFPR